jgi:conjugative element/phage-associated large polyvalent protein
MDQDTQLAPGEEAEQRYRSAGASDEQIEDWKSQKISTYKEAGATDDQINDYFGHVTHDNSAMKAHVTNNINAAKAARGPIDTSVKPVPAEDFMDSLAAGWGTGVTSLLQNAPVISPNDHLGRMGTIGNMIGQMAGDVPATMAGYAMGAPSGALAGGTVGSLLGPGGTLGGIALGLAVGGMAGANALPAGIRKLAMDHYEKGDIKDSSDFFNRLSAASWESIKAGTVGGVTGSAGYGAGQLAAGIGAKPLTAGIGTFGAELSTMATASAAMEKRLPNMGDFFNAAIGMGGLHAVATIVPKLMGIFKATGERPEEIVQAAKTDPVLQQEIISNNSDLPKIEVPSEEEQAKLGLKPVDKDGKIIEDQPTEENPKPDKPTEEQVQQAQTIQVAKEAAEEQKPPEDPVPRDPEPSPDLSDDEKDMLSFVGASDVKQDDSAMGAIKRDLVAFWKNEDTSRTGGEGFQSELMGKVSDEIAGMYIKGFDYTKGIGRIITALGKNLKANVDPEVLATLHSEFQTKVAAFLDHGTRDFKTGEVNGEGYKQITDDYKKVFPKDPMMDKLRAFGMALRVLEKAKQGMDIIVNTGTNPDGETISPEMAQRIVDQDDGTLAAFNKRRMDFRNRVLQYTHDSGYWTEAQYQGILDQNQAHMSFHRIQELDPLIGKAPGASKGVFKMKGVGNLIVDPLVSDLKDTQMLIQMAEENKVKRAMVEAAATGHDDAFLRKVAPNMKITQASGEELSKELDRQGIEHDPESVEAMTIFRSERARNGPNRMEVHIDGERQVYEGDSDTIDLMNRLRGNPPAGGMFSKMLATAAAGIRAGTINAWSFITKHTFRNHITGATYSETGMLPIIGPAMNAVEFAQGTSKDVQDFYFHGGAQSSFLAFDDNYIQSKIFAIDKQAPFMDRAFNLVQTAAQMSHVMILNNDNLIRFTEYKNLIAEGKNPTEAAYGARRVLPDVQAAGLNHSFWLSQTAFLGIHVRSMVRQGEAISDQVGQSMAALKDYNEAGYGGREGVETRYDVGPEPKLTDALKGPLARAVAFITMPAVLAAVYNQMAGTSKRIDRLEDWQRTGYFNLAHPSWESATPEQAANMPHEDLKRQLPDGSWQIDNGVTWKMQMPFTQGVFFGGLVQSFLDALHKKSPAPFLAWAKNVAESTVPSLIPNFMQPSIAQTTNYDAFTGRPVIPDNKLQLAPELQYEPYTTESAKAIGKLIGSVPYLGDIGPTHQKLASPMIVEEYVRDWTGPIGMAAMKLADRALAASSGKKYVADPTWEWADVPAIGGFVWRNDTFKTSDIDTFTNRYLKATSNLKSLKEYSHEGLGTSAAAEEFRDKNAEALAPYAGQYKAINNMRQYVQWVTANPDYSGVEKRQLIEPVFYRADEIAKTANEGMDSAAKAMRQYEDAKKKGN